MYFRQQEKNDELYHHGIKGQKWGIRRYQNPDGSLTAEGRKRYRLDSNGFIKNPMLREEFSNMIYDEADQKRKEYISNNPNGTKGSTGKNYDEANVYIDKELKEYAKGDPFNHPSIFDLATSFQDIENVMAEVYITATLKDLGYTEVEKVKKMMADDPKTYESTKRRIDEMLNTGKNVKFHKIK
jgi:hypothetical protein